MKIRKIKEMTKLKIGVFCLAVIIVLISFVPSIRTSILDSLSAIYASVLVNLTNKDRVAANIEELKVNPILERAAQMKADDMAEKGYFAHNTPDGKTPWYWFERAGYKYIYAGENLAVNFQDSEDIETAWMNSKPHFLNIINPKYTEIGIATSTGLYKGQEAVFVVQMFGTPQP
ncbi:MAG: CAP domain-containing protein [Candidatus Zambryskibacteria bacterium]|nr:CAP domain-containing protein [Candidatus Zambryskibacteria bacterium]